jgi:hypothetical protein
MEECAWRKDEGYWETDCKNEFTINEGTPEENGMIYCCFCGKKIKEFAKEGEKC